jgi:hypothetical protein
MVVYNITLLLKTFPPRCGVDPGNEFQCPTTWRNRNIIGLSWLWQLAVLVYSGFVSCPQQTDDDSDVAMRGIPEVLADSIN